MSPDRRRIIAGSRGRHANAVVTAGTNDGVVTRSAGPVAVCVVRLEHQGDGLLISLRLTLDIRSTSGEWRSTFGDVDEALATIRAFAVRFQSEAAAGGESDKV